MFRSTKLVARKVTQMGHVLTRRVPTGEMLSVASSDSDTFGMFAEAVGRAIAALLSFLFVAALVLSESLRLGLVVLIGAPLLVMAAAPLLRPLQAAQAIERERSSKLTGMATDIVAGLRILRGIGGERTFGDNYARQSQLVRRAGVRAGTWWSGVDATSVLLSGLLLVVLTWMGAREMMAGRLTVGQLISFFGYAVFLVRPIQTFFEAAQKWSQATVSAKKTIGVLAQQPPWIVPEEVLPLTSGRIRDEATGFTADPGELTIIVSALPDESAALADRIGRYLPTETQPVAAASAEVATGRKGRAERRRKDLERARIAAQDEERANEHWGVSLAGTDLSDLDLGELRRRVVVSDAAAAIFSGTLQELIDPQSQHSREDGEQVLWVASAEDVWEAMPGGWQGRVDERGRGLSGGQRQRLGLARVLLMDPEVLVMVEPTSAVDAHTEARIAMRVRGWRHGRTTLVTTVSPLWLHHADKVVLLRNGEVVAEGSHEVLLSSSPEYRDAVTRGADVVS